VVKNLVENATLVQFGTDIVASSTSIIGVFGTCLAIFMQPPIVFFLGIGVVASCFHMASRLIRRH